MDDSETGRKRDALGELIRAVGARAAPPEDVYESVKAASREAWRAKLRSRRRTRLGLALAASIAAAVAAGIVFQATQLSNPEPIAVADILRGDVAVFSPASGAWRPLERTGTALRAGDRIRTADESRAAFSLAPDVSLRIDESTELELIALDSLALHAGAVYVDTSDRPGASLEVSTPFGAVRDIGTQFEVRATGDALRLRVRTGAIELIRQDRTPERTQAGQEYRVTAGGDARVTDFAPDHADWAWVERLAVASDEPNQSVLAHLEWIARETGRKLEFDSEATALWAEYVEYPPSLAGLTPLEALDVLAQTSDFEWEYSPDGAIVISRR